MNLTFLHPSFLWGLSAVFLPPLLHMLARRREKQLVFSSVIFLKEVSRKTHSLSRITTLLLLLLRMLFIFFFSLFLSEPLLAPPHDGVIAQKSAVAIVLDASASMQMKAENKRTVFEHAKELISKKMSALPKDTPVTLFLSKNPPLQKQIFLGQDSGSLRASVESLRPSYSKSHLPQNIFSAVRFLQSQNEPLKELLVLSDFQKKDFNPAQIQTIPENIHVTFIPFSDKKSHKNTRVELLTPRRMFFKGVPASFKVASGEGKPASARVITYFNKRRIGENKVSQTFAVTPANSGPYCLQAQGKEDYFPQDDRFVYCFKAQDALKVLAIGDKKKIYYLSQALNAAKNSASVAVSPSFTSAAALSANMFSKHSCIILADVQDFRVTEIMSAVSRGTGLVVFLGDGIKTDFYKTKFLPYFNIMLQKNLPVSSSVLSAAVSDSLIFNTFTARDIQRTFSLRFVKAWDISALRQGRVSAFLDNSVPFLMETSYKKGKVIFVNTSVTPSHSNLVLTAAFLPLLLNTIMAVAPVAPENFNFSSDVKNVKPGILWNKKNQGTAVNLPVEESQPFYGAGELKKLFPAISVFAAEDVSTHDDESARVLSFAPYLFFLALLVFLCETFLSSRSVLRMAEAP